MSGLEEAFQNECLRPLLKNQHDWLIAAFVHYLEKHKISFGHLTSEEKFLSIDKIIKKDLSFRHYLIGLIVGNMRFEDFEIYLKSETKLNKRIVSMIIKRISSHYQIQLSTKT